jgi:hypothetical protein
MALTMTATDLQIALTTNALCALKATFAAILFA